MDCHEHCRKSHRRQERQHHHHHHHYYYHQNIRNSNTLTQSPQPPNVTPPPPNLTKAQSEHQRDTHATRQCPVHSTKSHSSNDRKTDVSNGTTRKCKRKKFFSVTLIIPHPEKRAKRGEDAAFANDVCFGVFDGVGGWEEANIDPGLYSKGLCKHCQDAVVQDITSPNSNPKQSAKELISNAVEAVDALGSSTALVGVLRTEEETKSTVLNVCNVGDCQAIIIRNGIVVFRTQEQQHAFNFPYQLQYDHTDDLNSADVRDFHVRDGDVIVAASDGLWDNVFEADIISTVSRYSKLWNCTSRSVTMKTEKGLIERKAFSVKVRKSHGGRESVFPFERLNDLAFDLGAMACINAHNPHGLSPFGQKAMREGKYAPGGKLDDITIMIALVRRSSHSYHAMYMSECGIPYTPPPLPEAPRDAGLEGDLETEESEGSTDEKA